MKREDYISWDDFFMGVAVLASKRSKDPSTQVGACIVDNKFHIVSVGYNGFPNKCSDDDLPWSSVGNFLDTKYAYVVHAELNAILNSNLKDLNNCIMYVTLFPCNECTKAIIQTGIKKFYYLSDKHHNKQSTIAARTMLNIASIEYVPLQSKNEIIIKLE